MDNNVDMNHLLTLENREHLTLTGISDVDSFNEEEIIAISRKIDTFDISIQPYEDCCTVFTPRHPKTHPTVEELLEAEQNYDFEGLCQKAFDGIERVLIPLAEPEE